MPSFVWLSRFRPSLLPQFLYTLGSSQLNELLFAPATSSYRSEMYLKTINEGAAKHFPLAPFPL
jgi:hypothetical protein